MRCIVSADLRHSAAHAPRVAPCRTRAWRPAVTSDADCRRTPDQTGAAVIRRAFRMSVHPGQQAEYRRRHNPIWRELEETLVRHGVRSYSIYLDPETNDLFAYAEIESEERWNAIASTDVCQRWWRHMRDIMPSNPDASPITRDLSEVFHIERIHAVAASPPRS
jgi:L-rhamnose mutarotase